MVITLCRTFGCTPSQLEREDASILRYVNIARLGMPQPAEMEPGYGE
jgi:hypothetical protein